MALVARRRVAESLHVACTYCGQPNEVSSKAMSVVCAHCRKRLVTENFKIDSYYAVREFFTCGEIVVEKSGHVVAPMKAGRLTVKGKVQGRVTSRGPVCISKGGQFRGDIEAPSLVVEGGGIIDGFVRIGLPVE